jgi:hypothetical protein
MDHKTLLKIKKAQNTKAKTIEIDDCKFIAPWQKLYFSPKRKYAIVNGGSYRWFIVDLFRNLESGVCTETKDQALIWVEKYEKNQINNGFENDQNKYKPGKINEEFYQTFGKNAFNERYFKK